MIRINLLPGGAQTRRTPARGAVGKVGLPKMPGDPRIAGLGAAAALFVLLAVFGWWRTGAARAQLTEQVAQAEADSARLARTISLMQQLESRRDTMERKIEVIRQVDGRRYVWPHLLDEISRAVPQFTWLTKITATEDEEPPAPAAAAPADSAAAAAAAAAAPAVVVRPGPSFTIEGSTGTPQALTRFMKNLEASPMIRQVALVTSEQATQEGRNFQRFTLEAKYEEPDSALIETVPVLTPR